MEQDGRIYLLHEINVYSSTDGDHIILLPLYRVMSPQGELGDHVSYVARAGDALMLRTEGVKSLYLGLRRSLTTNHPAILAELDAKLAAASPDGALPQ